MGECNESQSDILLLFKKNNDTTNNKFEKPNAPSPI